MFNFLSYIRADNIFCLNIIIPYFFKKQCFFKIFFNLSSCLFFLFLPHPLEVNAKCFILQSHQHSVLYFFDNFLLLPRVLAPNIPSNPPVLNPNVFKSSCAINTYVLILPLLINGYPAVPHAGLPKRLSKCTQVGVRYAGSPVTYIFKTIFLDIYI